MAALGLSFPRAYCYVRARRLNVIIQPHLRFVYELMKWDEKLQVERSVAAPHTLKITRNGSNQLGEPIPRGGTPMSRKRSRSEANKEDDKKEEHEEETEEKGQKEKDKPTASPVGNRMVTPPVSTIGIRREVEWPTICREIASLNKPYARQ